MKYLAAIICLVAASCAPKAIVVRPISEQAAVVVGAVKVVQANTDRVQHRSDEIGKNVQDLAAQVAVAQAKADKLSREKQVTQAQLEQNARDWAAAKKLADDMTRTAEGLRFDVGQLSMAVAAANSEADKMRKKAHEQDAAVKKLETRIADMSADYELGKTIRHAAWFVVIGIVVAMFVVIGLYFFGKAGKAAAEVAKTTLLP